MPIDREMQPHFRDVTDHVRRVSEEIDALREVLAFAFISGHRDNARTSSCARRSSPVVFS
jgi:hypothetical protein